MSIVCCTEIKLSQKTYPNIYTQNSVKGLKQILFNQTLMIINKRKVQNLNITVLVFLSATILISRVIIKIN